LSTSGVNDLIVQSLSNVISSMGAQLAILVLFLVFFVLSFLIPSTSGFAAAVFPSVGPALIQSQTLSVSGAILAFSLSSGVINVVSPTSGPFVAALGVSKLSLVDFYKGA